MQDPGFVRRAFADIADRYVLTNHVLSLGTDVLWRRKLVRRVREQAPARVLDVATGSGDVAAELRRRSPEIELIGVDFCLPMLRHARRAGLKSLLVADGLHLPFDVDTFDAVTVAFGLRNMASWEAALTEWRRVLRPGRHLHVLDFSRPRRQPLRGLYGFYLHRMLPRIAGILTQRREAYEYLSSSIDQFPDGEAMCRLLETAGFSAVTAEPLSGGIATIYGAQKPPA